MARRVSIGFVAAGLLWLLTGESCVRASTLGDIFYRHGSADDHIAAAYFPHWVHRIKYKCYACHDDLFPMQRGANPTMAAMAKGQSCGACHNGAVAFGLDTCQRCHVGP
ncbi:MAG TPA: cytochrome c3 family protein [Candidatus Binatia bacterium]|nr:cytochrome c3 family protein [Candidatus Binatia bacterium]